MSHEEMMINAGRLTILDQVLKHILSHYDKQKDEFYIKKEMNCCLPTRSIYPTIIEHALRNGVSYRFACNWLKNKKNIYHLIVALRKDIFLNVALEEVEDFTEILGYNEYKRDVIRYLRICQLTNTPYNRSKWIEIGKNAKLAVKSLITVGRYSKDALKRILYIED